MTTPPNAPPQNVTLNFSSPIVMFTFFALDRAAVDLLTNANALQMMSAPLPVIELLRARAAELQATRDAFHRQDQGAIGLVGAGGLPPGGRA
jgi:hypothetical protein